MRAHAVSSSITLQAVSIFAKNKTETKHVHTPQQPFLFSSTRVYFVRSLNLSFIEIRDYWQIDLKIKFSLLLIVSSMSSQLHFTDWFALKKSLFKKPSFITNKNDDTIMLAGRITSIHHGYILLRMYPRCKRPSPGLSQNNYHFFLNKTFKFSLFLHIFL